MRQPVAGVTFPLPRGTRGRFMGRLTAIKNIVDDTVHLKAVRAGDIVRFGGISMRVLSAERQAGLVTLELEDQPARPMTLVGLPDMPVHRDTLPEAYQGDGNESPDSGPAPG
jgi:hypothetical protein